MPETPEIAQEETPDISEIKIVGHVKKLQVVAFSDFSHTPVESYHNLNGPCTLREATFGVFIGPDGLYYTFQLNEHPELTVQ